MSTTIQQAPASTTLNSAFRPVVVRSSSTNPAAPKFRYLYRLQDENDNTLLTLRIPPNAAGQGIAEFSRAVRSFLNLPWLADVGTTGTPAPLLTDAVATAYDGALPARLFQWQAGFQSAATEASAPVETWEHSGTFTAGLFIGNDLAASTAPALNGIPRAGYLPQATTAPGWATEWPADTTTTTHLSGVGYPRTIPTRAATNSVHLFHRGTNAGAGYNVGADVAVVRYAYQTPAGAWSTTTVNADAMLGGNSASVSHDGGLTCLLATGAANLQAAGITGLSAAFAAGVVARYEVVLENGAGAPVSCVLRFEMVDDDCYNGRPVRVAWINRAGGWEYFDFTKRRERKLMAERSTYRPDTGTWNSATNFERWVAGGNGELPYRLNAGVQYTLTTDYLSDEYSALLEGLHMATGAYVLLPNGEGFDVARAVVESTEYTTRSTAYDRLFQHTITLTLGRQYEAV